jgi:hypothetical protein
MQASNGRRVTSVAGFAREEKESGDRRQETTGVGRKREEGRRKMRSLAAGDLSSKRKSNGG